MSTVKGFSKQSSKSEGFSLIDLIISIGIIALLFGGIFLAYSSIIDSTKNSSTRTAAVSVLEQQAEIIRNLPYDQVGTQGGIPSGVVPQTQTVLIGDASFMVATTVRNIDDPFDGTLGGIPNDTAPADYKLIELSAQCIQCYRQVTYAITTTVAPENLESASTNGSLFINIADAEGKDVSNVDVHVVNASVTPAIDLTDTTDASGVLQLVGIPTSTQSYALTLTKSGYSSEKTYPVGAPANPNPINSHATVAAGMVTTATFSIDKTSRLDVTTSNDTCIPAANKDFSLSGAKLIGLNPNTLKFGTSSATGASGVKTLNGIEWDTYTFALEDSGLDLFGTIPLNPMTINPSSTSNFRFVAKPANPLSLLVIVKDFTTSAGINTSTVVLSKSGFSETHATGQSEWIDTDWSAGQYDAQDGGVETDSPAGLIAMKNVNGLYSTSTVSWLVSKTIDVGSSTASYYAIEWNPSSQPAQTGSESVQFQIAAKNDQATRNFVGPDGTGNTYYSVPGSAMSDIHENNRYLRYKIFLKTQD